MLMKSNVDMSSTTGEEGETSDWRGETSDAEAEELVEKEKEVELFTVGKNRTRAGGSFFPYLHSTIFDLSKDGILNLLIERSIHIIVVTSL